MGCKKQTLCVIGVGSNLGDRAANVAGAIMALASLPRTTYIARGPIVASRAMTPPDEPTDAARGGAAAPGRAFADAPGRGGAYLNTVVVIATEMDAPALMAQLHSIEARFGRRRAEETHRWQARTLDLDLLLYGEDVIDSADLRVPHPGLRSRVFWLEPLSEVMPMLRIPASPGALNETIAEAFERLRAGEPAALAGAAQ